MLAARIDDMGFRKFLFLKGTPKFLAVRIVFVNSLALFSNIEVNLHPNEKNEGGIIVEIKLKELKQKTAEVST